jgi:hypothetical protein
MTFNGSAGNLFARLVFKLLAASSRQEHATSARLEDQHRVWFPRKDALPEHLQQDIGLTDGKNGRRGR